MYCKPYFSGLNSVISPASVDAFGRSLLMQEIVFMGKCNGQRM